MIKSENTRTKVCIIIPAYNEEKYIKTCLLSCVQQEPYNFDLEIIVCDGISNDQTVKIVTEMSISYPCIKLISNSRMITPVALNLGFRSSDADIKIILGAHSELYPDFIKRNLMALATHSDAACVGGIIENVYLDKTSEQIGKAMSSTFGVGNAYFRTGKLSGYVDTVAFGAYRKEAVDKIGLFDEELIRNQDDEYNFRLTKNGLKIFLDSTIRSKYFVRSSFLKLFRQYFQYGFWKVYVNKKHRSVTTIRQLIPFLFVFFLLVFPFLFFFSNLFLFFYLSVLILYLNIATFVTLYLKGSFGVILSFFVLHFSYGLGYLFGLFRFLLLNKNAPSRQDVTR